MLVFDPEAVRSALAARGWSLAYLAHQLGTPKTTVSGWLNGRHQPQWGQVERLARVLGIPPTALVREATAFTPGVSGGVPLSQAQALVLAAAVALVREDPDALAADWLGRLKPGEAEQLRRRLVIAPQWAHAWAKLARLGAGDHPLAPYTIQVRIVPKGGAR